MNKTSKCIPESSANYVPLKYKCQFCGKKGLLDDCESEQEQEDYWSEPYLAAICPNCAEQVDVI